MKLNDKRKRMKIGLASLPVALMLAAGCGNEPRADRGATAPPPSADGSVSISAEHGKVLVTNRLDVDFAKHKVTFIEIGADRCIPCIQMQPIMKEIAQEYAGTIQVVFYDVWKDPTPARKYGIQLIPTQVFVNPQGREIFRHVGFFPKADILKMLKEKGAL